jgi:hypothetical protein
MKKALKILLLIMTVVLLYTPETLARSNKGIVRVSARVLPSVSKSVVHQVSIINITPEDIKKGYVDVEAGTVLQVKTNSRDGYSLAFESIGGLFTEIWVIDGSRSTVLSNMRGLIHQPYAGNLMGETKKLSYKFFLSANVKPGSYPWPLMLNATIN